MTTLSEVLAAIDDGVSRFGAPTPYADLMSSNYLRANRDRLLRAEAMLAAVESEAWKCVPVEASEELLASMVIGLQHGEKQFHDLIGPMSIAYAAMLAVAPSPLVETVQKAECPHRTRCECLGACKYGFAGGGAVPSLSGTGDG